jgi:hypothetical protein
MLAGSNDARVNATAKKILLDMARPQSAIEFRLEPFAPECEITTEHANELAWQIVEHVAARPRSKGLSLPSAIVLTANIA